MCHCLKNVFLRSAWHLNKLIVDKRTENLTGGGVLTLKVKGLNVLCSTFIFLNLLKAGILHNMTILSCYKKYIYLGHQSSTQT